MTGRGNYGNQQGPHHEGTAPDVPRLLHKPESVAMPPDGKREMGDRVSLRPEPGRPTDPSLGAWPLEYAASCRTADLPG
jgi:hypothetical protein